MTKFLLIGRNGVQLVVLQTSLFAVMAFSLFCLTTLPVKLIGQSVTDPSQTIRDYDAIKMESIKVGSTVVAGRLENSNGEVTPGTQLPACFVPLDPTFTPIPRNDDGSFGPVPLPFTFSLYGTNYNQVWINTNGNLTFLGPFGTFTPTGFPFSVPMVAPFWGDVDTRTGGLIYYKLNPTNMIVTWDAVGYYNQHTDKVNTFQVVIGTFADLLTGLGQNVCFHYGDMQWTTGDASGGVGGFGGSPATVGINEGNAVDFIQIGRFGIPGAAYDGPGGATDGVDYLDDRCTCFNVSNAGNIPPALASGGTGPLNLQCGQTATITLDIIGPEVNQTVTSVVNTGGLCNTVVNVVDGFVSTVTITVTGAACNSGLNLITITSTDNGTPAETSVFTIVINVDNCCALTGSVTSVTDESCPGAGDGAIDISHSGGVAPVLFQWSNGETTEDISGLSPGTYDVTITDAANCVVILTATVGTVPDVTPPTINCPANMMVQCFTQVPAPNPNAPTATDNCGPVTVTFDSDSHSGGSGCAGSPHFIARVYKATDGSGNMSFCTQLITVMATPVVAAMSPNAYVFPAFPDSACTTISVSASGGCPPYTYSWDNGSTSSSQSVCPVVTTTYCVTVTDAQGCTASGCVTVCPVNVLCDARTNNGQGGSGQSGNGQNQSPNAQRHIYMCHIPPGNPGNAMTKCLPIPGVAGHMAAVHGGDHLGPCGSLGGRSCVRSSNKEIAYGEFGDLSSLGLNAMPNPFSYVTTIRAYFPNAAKASVRVYDMKGSFVKTLFDGQVEDGQVVNLDFNGSMFADGIYFARLNTTNGESKSIRINLMK